MPGSSGAPAGAHRVQVAAGDLRPPGAQVVWTASAAAASPVTAAASPAAAAAAAAEEAAAAAALEHEVQPQQHHVDAHVAHYAAPAAATAAAALLHSRMGLNFTFFQLRYIQLDTATSRDTVSNETCRIPQPLFTQGRETRSCPSKKRFRKDLLQRSRLEERKWCDKENNKR